MKEHRHLDYDYKTVPSDERHSFKRYGRKSLFYGRTRPFFYARNVSCINYARNISSIRNILWKKCFLQKLCTKHFMHKRVVRFFHKREKYFLHILWVGEFLHNLCKTIVLPFMQEHSSCIKGRNPLPINYGRNPLPIEYARKISLFYE